MLGTYEERMRDLRALYPFWTAETIWTRFEKNAERFAEQPFILFEDTVQTYHQVKEAADQLAASLLLSGVRSGDHVALLMYNCPAAVELIFALAKIGAVRVPIHAAAGIEEAMEIMEHAACVLLITQKPMPPELLDRLPSIRGVVLLCGQEENPRYMDWEAFFALGEGRQVFAAPQTPEDLANILFTSGSTSSPKGVMVTHDMVLRCAFGTVRRRGMEIGRRIFVPTPLFHTMAYVEGLMAAMLVGGSVIMMREKFNSQCGLRLMKQFEANDIICVTVIMMDLLSKGDPRPEDFPALHAAYWASICPQWLWGAVREAFGIQDVTTGYGMTECGSTTSMISPLDDPSRVAVCHGRVKPGVEWDSDTPQLLIKICDPETGHPVLPGSSGELRCYGKTVTKGYYRDPQATKQAFDEEGWFKTQDICRMDEAGYLTFEGRLSDVYKINGENVSPQFIDSVISKCPAVRAVETVGVPDPKHGEIGVAFLDTYRPFEQVRGEIQQFCQQNLAAYQVPKVLIPSDSGTWPRTPVSGKVQKSKLRQLAQQHLQQDSGALD